MTAGDGSVGFAFGRVFGTTPPEASTFATPSQNLSSAVTELEAHPKIPLCPECGASKVYRSGFHKQTQRYLCRCCGRRFSAKTLNIEAAIVEGAKYAPKEAKNLVFTAAKTVVGDATLQGLLTRFYSYLEKEAYSTESMYPKMIQRLAMLKADLYDPESVKAVIAKMTYVDSKTGETKKVRDGTKMLYCAAYGALCNMLKIEWSNPGYRQEEIEVYVPYETELDALINGTKSRRLAAFLQCLKETFADPSEALRIRWIDIDFQNHTIKINFPVKNHNSGTIQVSTKLLDMISALPRINERVFVSNYTSMSEMFRKLRKRIASIQQNPRINAVELRGFRHWGGTKLAYETNGNVLIVKKLLRHKSVKSTMKYIGRIDFKPDEFETTSATSVDEILALGSKGWVEYSVVRVGAVEVHCFRKPKRFNNSPQFGITSQNLGLNT